jgi:Ca2+-binding RTX toxin-like protein
MKAKAAVLGAIVAGVLALAPAAQAGVLASSGGIVYYIGSQGERNDVVISVDNLLGVPVYSVTDNDAIPITIGAGGGPFCELVNGVGMCRAAGIGSLFVDSRDRDDTITVAEAGPFGGVPVGARMIGGRGVDVLMGGNGGDILKGGNGRDSLRGRMGPDGYRAGRGSDVLQTLDGGADAWISCGPGFRDLLRADKADPPSKNCELGKFAKRAKRR